MKILNSTLLSLAAAALLFWTANGLAEESPAAKPSASSGTAPATEAKPLRDPTVMSPRFREALKNMSSQGNSATTNDPAHPAAPKMPTIRLLGLISGAGGQPSALLGIGKDQQPYLVTGGVEISLTSEDSPGGGTTIEVKSVTRSEVQLLLKPFNRMIILR